jgi:dipeptidyl aminopeptidase/acylaminoacyl peptidase
MNCFSFPARIFRFAVLILLLGVLGSFPEAVASPRPADKHAFAIGDWEALRHARAVAVSPDGMSILYRVAYDGDKGREKHEWRLIDLSGENGRKLELAENFSPSGFMKDGTALFGIYEVENKGQLAIVPLSAGKPTQILALPNGIRAPVISPDGTRFAVLADPRTLDPLAEVRHVVENDVVSIYTVGVNGADGAWWCPELKSVADLAWSPDGSQLAVVTQSPKIGNHDFRSEISVCASSGARRVAEIANATAGVGWADDGKTLAFASTTTHVLTPDHLWTVPTAGGAPVDRTPKLDGSILSVASDPRGTVWVEIHKGTIAEIYAYREGKLEPAYRWPGGIIYGTPAVSPFASSPGVLAFTVGDPAHASNVAVAQQGELKRITHEGDETLAGVSLGDVRVVKWMAKDGTKLEGVLTLPATYESGKKYPFLVLPHGGPEGNDNFDFDPFSRLIAGFAYVVLQPQYRGSTGYGSDFLEAIYQHFGDRAYSDVDSATDFAIAQGWADPIAWRFLAGAPAAS